MQCGRKHRTNKLTRWKTNSKLRKSFDYSCELRDFTKTEHNVHFPYFGWKSCWLMAALPAGEWLFKIILEARKRKSSNNGLMSDEPGTEHNTTLKMNTDFNSKILLHFPIRAAQAPEATQQQCIRFKLKLTCWELTVWHRFVERWDQDQSQKQSGDVPSFRSLCSHPRNTSAENTTSRMFWVSKA